MPREVADGHEERTGGVGDVDKVQTTIDSTRKILATHDHELHSVQDRLSTHIDQPRVHGPKHQYVRVMGVPHGFVMIQHPSQLDG